MIKPDELYECYECKRRLPFAHPVGIRMNDDGNQFIVQLCGLEDCEEVTDLIPVIVKGIIKAVQSK